MNEGTTTIPVAAPGSANAAGSTLLVSGIMLGMSLVASLAFGYYLFIDPTRLADAWIWIRELPLLVQLVLWALFLPWMIALWVWSMPWAFGLRMVIVVAILGAAEYVLFPWKR